MSLGFFLFVVDCSLSLFLSHLLSASRYTNTVSVCSSLSSSPLALDFHHQTPFSSTNCLSLSLYLPLCLLLTTTTQVMPGLLLCFVLRYDAYKRLQLSSLEAGVPPPNHLRRITYFHCSLIGYFFGQCPSVDFVYCCLHASNIFPLTIARMTGLLTATVSSEVFKAAQPALLYLVPFTLLPLLTMAYLKVCVWCPDVHASVRMCVCACVCAVCSNESFLMHFLMHTHTHSPSSVSAFQLKNTAKKSLSLSLFLSRSIHYPHSERAHMRSRVSRELMFPSISSLSFTDNISSCFCVCRSKARVCNISTAVIF